MKRQIRKGRGDGGFSLLEVLVSVAIIGMAVVALQSSLGGAVDKAMATKVNRQMRHLAQFQYGQVVVGKLHPEEQDPFLDGQTGGFEDVGGYPEEYRAFGWEVRVDEVAVCGASNLDLEEAGFAADEGGQYSRALTDDLVQATQGEGAGGGGGFGALLRGEAPRPEGQFRRRITLTLHWAAANAEADRAYTLVTLVPVEDDGALPAPGDVPGLPGAGGAPGGGAAGGGSNLLGGDAKDGGR